MTCCRSRSRSNIKIAIWLTAVFVLAATAPACAESCTQSREYILTSSPGELPEKPQSYQDLFKTCMETLSIANVKDAFLLIDGGIGVIPKHNDISATANILSEFCQAFPARTLRFLTPKEQLRVKNIALKVKISSTSATPCKKIMGNDS
ncbi:MAG TPA: hypothetical protein VFB45_07980 [Pseudolabrys sp.]|nr:hypothetical protein [Pseudolabrys sp.]